MSEELERTLPSFYFETKVGKGPDGVEKEHNQDRFCVREEFLRIEGCSRVSLFVVADGHGPKGQITSEYCIRHIPDLMLDEFVKSRKLTHALARLSHGLASAEFATKFTSAMEVVGKHVADRLQGMLEKHVSQMRSGSVCCWVMVAGAHVFSWNVGDCKACVVKRKGGSVASSSSRSSGAGRDAEEEEGFCARILRRISRSRREMRRRSRSRAVIPQEVSVARRTFGSGELEVISLTWEHRPQDEKELARIRDAGGKVTDAGVTGVKNVRVWGDLGNGRWLGLSMSRSFGDVIMHRHGVSHTPDLTSYKLSPGRELALILASDGLWTHLVDSDWSDVFDRIASDGEHIRPDSLCVCLMRVARRSWERTTGGEVDDVTVGVVALSQA